MSIDLSGKVIAITGGARGIGAATARALVAAGASVAIGDLDLDLATQTAAALGPRAVSLSLDVTDRSGFTAFLDEVERQLGPLDVLINNAGIMPVVAFEDETEQTTQRQLDINVHAVIHGSREAVRRMKPRGRGHIVNIASMAGKAGLPGVATYCATKHAVVGLCEALALELAGTGIEITCVMPGVVNTELAAGLGHIRGIKTVEPEDVADAIVAALRDPRLEVFVPRIAGATNYVARLLPRRAMEVIARLLGADTALISAASSPERAAYESRAGGR